MESNESKLLEKSIVNKGFYKLLLCNGFDFVCKLQKEFNNKIHNTQLKSLCIDIENEYKVKIPIIQQELNNLCVAVDKNPDFVCCGRVFEFSKLKFDELFNVQNNNLIKPNEIKYLFENEGGNCFELVLNNNLCSYREYEKNYFSLNLFPIEIRHIWNLFKTEIKSNYEQLFKLLNEKYFIRIIKHKITNEFICFQITSDAKHWRTLDSSKLDLKSLIICIIKYMSICTTNDLRKLMCYLFVGKYDLFPTEERFLNTDVDWKHVIFVNKTFENNKMVWVTIKHRGDCRFINSGFYMLIPDEIPDDLTENELEVLLRQQYHIKRIYSKSGYIECCCWLEKNTE